MRVLVALEVILVQMLAEGSHSFHLAQRIVILKVIHKLVNKLVLCASKVLSCIVGQYLQIS